MVDGELEKLDLPSVGFITRQQLGYIAGIIDGEGSISITSHPDKRQKTTHEKYIPRLNIVNTNLDLILYMQKLIGGRVTVRKGVKKNWKTTYELILSANAMRRVLPQIKDCLVAKRRQAMLTLEYLDLARVGWAIADRNPEEITRMREIREKLKELNRRGIREIDGVI